MSSIYILTIFESRGCNLIEILSLLSVEVLNIFFEIRIEMNNAVELFLSISIAINFPTLFKSLFFKSFE